jgi:hypothetical protein
MEELIKKDTKFKCIVEVSSDFYLEIYNDMKKDELLRKPIPIDLGEFIVLIIPQEIKWMANTKKLHLSGRVIEKPKDTK